VRDRQIVGNFWNGGAFLLPLMIKYLNIVFALSVTIPTASAFECRTEVPSGAAQYWSWRIIDGRKCWYPGRPGMSKANLHWPKAGEPTTGQSRAPEAIAPNGFQNSLPDVAPQPHQSEVSRPNGETTFKERWPSGR
jgi:hypothetical protein